MTARQTIVCEELWERFLARKIMVSKWSYSHTLYFISSAGQNKSSNVHCFSQCNLDVDTLSNNFSKPIYSTDDKLSKLVSYT